uniref:Uncharacterized protein n=1 Tax=Romanomermis culicivorax TaxID=13658 RepID=A0A915JQP3_ROMCU
MGPMDVQTPQAPSMSAPALDRHGQPIRKPGRYEHSVKCKQHLQEEERVQWKSHILRECSHPVLGVLRVAKRPANEQPVTRNNAINKKLVKRPVNLLHRQLRRHS